MLKYFRSYMSEHLLKAGGTAGERPVEEGVRLPHLRTWFRTRSAIILHLSNGSLQVNILKHYIASKIILNGSLVLCNIIFPCLSIQINFFQDHTKLVICPLMSAVSYIDESKNFRTFKLNMIERFGCSKDICNRLRYAKTMVERLIEKLDSSTPMGKQAPTMRGLTTVSSIPS